MKEWKATKMRLSKNISTKPKNNVAPAETWQGYEEQAGVREIERKHIRRVSGSQQQQQKKFTHSKSIYEALSAFFSLSRMR